MIQYLEPTRVVTYENCEGAENLLKGNPAQAGFNDRNCVKIRQGGYVLLDFGKEINGALSITTSAHPSCGHRRGWYLARA